MIKKNRTFGLVVGSVLIAYTAAQYLLKGKNNITLATIGLCLLLLAWLKPYWLTPLQILWEKIGFIMGLVNTYVLLTVFYFLVLTPVGLLRKLFSKPVKRFQNPKADSYWQAATIDNNDHFKNQY